MRTPLIATLSVTALLLTAGSAFAAPLELTCKENRTDPYPLHVIVDEDAGTISLDGDQHRAQFNDTRVVWDEPPRFEGWGGTVADVHPKGTLDRKTGTLIAHTNPFVPHPRKMSRSDGSYTVTCAKAEQGPVLKP